MDNVETISVLMCTFREPMEWIKLSLESILKQSYKKIEIILIVDDPDNEELINFLELYASDDKRIRIIINNENIGLVKSLNKGLHYCSGKYIARMDADDIALPTRLEEELNFLVNNDLDIVGCKFESFSDDKILGSRSVPTTINKCNKMLNYTNCVGHPTWLVKKEVYFELKGYRNIYGCEDYDFLMRAVLLNYRVACINKILLKYRNNKNSISGKNYYLQRITSMKMQKLYRKKNIMDINSYNNWFNSKQKLEEIEKFFNYDYNKREFLNSNGLKKINYLLKLLNTSYFYEESFSKLCITLIMRSEN